MIQTSLKKTLSIIKKNKSKIFLIFFLQVIFFIILSIISYHTILPSMQHAKNVMDYYNEINITESPDMFGKLGEDPLMIYENYTKMMFYLRFMILFFLLTFVIINGLLWTLSNNLLNKKDLKQSLNYFSTFGIVTLIFSLLVYILIFNTLRASLAELEYNLLPLIGILVLSIILIYFLFISFSLIHKRKPKDILKLTFRIGIFKFPKIILIYLINLIIISFFSFLLYLTIELNIIFLFITIILFVLSFVFTRLFFMISINDLKKN